jgi:hypothetical protein
MRIIKAASLGMRKLKRAVWKEFKIKRKHNKIIKMKILMKKKVMEILKIINQLQF